MKDIGRGTLLERRSIETHCGTGENPLTRLETKDECNIPCMVEVGRLVTFPAHVSNAQVA